MGILRLYFAFSVLLGHAQLDWFISPIYAVEGFYIISGFYMSLILNEKYTTPATNLTFYKKRFLRLLPTYWLIAGIALLLAIWLYQRGESNIQLFDFLHFPPNASIFTHIYIFMTNIFVIGQDVALFMGISPNDGSLFLTPFSYGEEYPLIRYMLLPVAWSVSSEFFFYLLAPFVLRNKQKVVAVLLLLSVASNVITNYYGLNDSNWRFRFFPSELMFFLTGYLAYLLYRKCCCFNPSKRNRYPALFSTLILLTFVLKQPISYAVHTFLLIILCLTAIPYLFYSFRHDVYDRLIGEMSYPLYLIHPLFISIAPHIMLYSTCFVIIGSLLSSWFCYHFFILPIERIRSQIK